MYRNDYLPHLPSGSKHIKSAVNSAHNANMSTRLGYTLSKGGKILKTGFNHRSPGKYGCHCEMDGISWLIDSLRMTRVFRLTLIGKISPPTFKGGYARKGSTYKMTVVRILRITDVFANSRPCIECKKWIVVCHKLGINIKIKHTDDDGNFVKYDGVSVTSAYCHPYA